jgi:hypothetical protein
VELSVGCPRVIHVYERGSVLEEPDDPAAPAALEPVIPVDAAGRTPGQVAARVVHTLAAARSARSCPAGGG